MVVGTLKPSIKWPCPSLPPCSVTPLGPLASTEVVWTLKPTMVPTTYVGARGRGMSKGSEWGSKGAAREQGGVRHPVKLSLPEILIQPSPVLRES